MKSISTLAFLILTALMLSGCTARATQFGEINPGMTKAEVQKILGTPDGVGLEGGKEYMNYRVTESPLDWAHTSYTVVLQGGKVVSYGRQDQVR